MNHISVIELHKSFRDFFFIKRLTECTGLFYYYEQIYCKKIMYFNDIKLFTWYRYYLKKLKVNANAKYMHIKLFLKL